jgi:hypothetical protein
MPWHAAVARATRHAVHDGPRYRSAYATVAIVAVPGLKLT